MKIDKLDDAVKIQAEFTQLKLITLIRLKTGQKFLENYS